MSTFLRGLFHSQIATRAIIIVPASLPNNWINELGRVGLSNALMYVSSTLYLPDYSYLYFVMRVFFLRVIIIIILYQVLIGVLIRHTISMKSISCHSFDPGSSILF